MAEDYFKDTTEEQFCAWVDKQASKHPVVKVHHGIWKELIDWEDGNQFSVWDESKRAVVPVDLKVRKLKVVINIMKPLNETIEGKLNFNHHIIGVPNSGEQKDVKGSQVATKFLDHNDDTNKMEELMEDMKHDLLRPGISCIKWLYDKESYALNKNGNRVKMGEVIGEVVPIFNVRPDPVAKKPSDMRWLIELAEKPKEEIKQKFNVPDSFFEESSESKAEKHVGMNVKQEEIDKDEDTYVLKYYWERPNETYKDGRFIVTCAGHVIFADKNPSPEGKIPYFFFFYKKSPYSFWPKGPLHFIQDIQRWFNRMISMMLEHVEAWRPKIAVSKGGLKRAQSMTIDPFEIVEVGSAGTDIKPIQMPELSQHVMELRNFFLQMRDMVSNVHEVSYARLPQYASRAPASLYSMMLEQENVKLSPMVKRINETLVDMARFRLQLMDKHYTTQRMVKVLGTNKKAMLEHFEAADMNKNFDVRLEIGVSLNQSTTIQQRLLIEMWQAQILGPEDRPKIKRMMFEGTGAEALRADMADEDKAERENQAFIDDKHKKKRQEGGVSVDWNDDHALHLERHTDLLKSEEAQAWDDEKYIELQMHIFEHFIFHQKLTMAMAAQASPRPQLAQERMGGMPGPQPGQEPTIEGFGEMR